MRAQSNESRLTWRARRTLRVRPFGLFCLIVLITGTVGGAGGRRLTFEERVAAQEAIERVYYAHQIGATRPFEEAIPDAVIRGKVTTYLKQSLALERFWNTPLTAAMLQAEMKRMAAGSRMPERLRELHRALGDDAFIIQETLVRSALVDRLARSFFASGDRFGTSRPHGKRTATHGAEERRGYEEWWGDVSPSLDPDGATAVASSALLVHAGDETTLPATSRGMEFGLSTACTAGDLWDNGSLDDLPSPRSGHTAVWTGSRVIIWGGAGTGGNTDTGSRYDPATDTWRSTSPVNAPTARSGHTAVWTGTEMIVWGGAGVNTGAAYDPVADSWRTLATTGAPPGRSNHVAVWTGGLMLVWGGEGSGSSGRNDGGRYEPVSDSWTPTAALDAPAGRARATAVWTGTEMIVYGGLAGGSPSTIFDDGGRYDPAMDAWSAIPPPAAGPRFDHTAVWTGTEMIVWGGTPAVFEDLNTGGRYDPVANAWQPTSTVDAPEVRRLHTAAWTGDRMIVWGGAAFPCCDFNEPRDTGGVYDPATDTWTPTSTEGVPFPRDRHIAVWTGDLMIVWGGQLTVVTFGGTTTTPWGSGGRYDPDSDTWTPTSLGAGPLGSGQSAVWTGNEMIVWGGRLAFGPFSSILFSTGGRYDPALDHWTPTSAVNPPEARQLHTAVWTGSEMIVWGGSGTSGRLATGSRYDPLFDAWSPVSAPNAPSPRRSHTAIWTGDVMIVWGGNDGTTGVPGTGGRYVPANDTWGPMTTTNAPLSRENHTAVWTASEMIVWGSNSSTTARTGGRYDPAADAWMPTTLTNAPSTRFGHSAVWSGDRMIVWGGSGLQSGALYDPGTDSWTPTSLTGAPSGRSAHRAVWTGDEMIVWGGSGGGTTGGRYSRDLDAWTATTTFGAPTPRSGHVAVWTDSSMIVWGGTGAEGTGGRYSIDNDLDDDGFTPCDGDCDDADPTVNPSAAEVCNGIDDDCDDATDEGGDALCDDQASCTTDSCGGAGGCSNAPLAEGVLCPGGSAGNACTGPDTCDGAGACVPGAFLPAGTLCGDTTDTSCTNPDVCDGTGSCLANDEPDGTACTREDDQGDQGCDVCVAGACVSLEDDQGEDDDGDGVSDTQFDSLRLALLDPATLRLTWQEPPALPGLRIDGYRVWQRDHRGCPWRLATVVTGTEATLAIPPGEGNAIYSVTARTGPQP